MLNTIAVARPLTGEVFSIQVKSSHMSKPIEMYFKDPKWPVAHSYKDKYHIDWCLECITVWTGDGILSDQWKLKAFLVSIFSVKYCLFLLEGAKYFAASQSLGCKVAPKFIWPCFFYLTIITCTVQFHVKLPQVILNNVKFFFITPERTSLLTFPFLPLHHFSHMTTMTHVPNIYIHSSTKSTSQSEVVSYRCSMAH